MTVSNPHERRSWYSMNQRCRTPTAPGYENYGGRGITICERWEVFDNFLADMGPRPSLSYSLDRIDVNGNYEPGNCRWATKQEQQSNRRDSRIIEHDGRSQTLEAWARECGMSRQTLDRRIAQYGMERAMAMPPSERWGHNADKTHCKAHHEFTDENIRWKRKTIDGELVVVGRACRQCQQDKDAARRAVPCS